MTRSWTLPVTIYAVAMVYFHKLKDGRTCCASHLETVSGKHPLNADEIKGRAEAEVRRNWSGIFGKTVKSEDYELALWHVTSSTLTS